MFFTSLADADLIPTETFLLQFQGLSLAQNLVHGVFTRHGGVSSQPFDTLNTSYSVGDHRESVSENIRKIKDTVKAADLMYMNQTHGDDILVLRQGSIHTWGRIPDVDALITDVPGVALLVKQADCQGAIIHDPGKGVVAAVHCGWRGNVKNILAGVVDRMKEEFGCKAQALQAAIGPSLGPCCAEFIGHKEIFPKEFRQFMVGENHFDLWAISSRQLINAGLSPDHIEVAGLCTRCRTDLFFSYRAEGKTGRFGTVVMLKPPGTACYNGRL